MKLTRSFWFGLGTGLILSAMLALIFTPRHDQADQRATVQTPLPAGKETGATETTLPLQSAESGDSENSETNPVSPSEPGSSQIDENFVIPKGASAEKIAELLLDQGYIKDKDTFLNSAHQLGVERQFRAGTFKLSLGLTEEELVKRLLK